MKPSQDPPGRLRSEGRLVIQALAFQIEFQYPTRLAETYAFPHLLSLAIRRREGCSDLPSVMVDYRRTGSTVRVE